MKKIIPADAVLIPAHAKCVFKGVIFDVFQWQQKMFDGSEATFEMLRRPDTVTAICIVDDAILFLEDEQPHRGTKITIPGGRVDPEDTSTLAAIQREVHEETGYSFANWRLVAVRQPQAKIEWFVYIYIAWEVTAHDAPHSDAGERIKLQPQSLAFLKQKMTEKASDYGDLQKDVGPLVQDVSSLQELITTPAFTGQEAQR
jgi:ADP-ribose pyrophosphatase YjhB (NUDIX family)